MFGRNNNAKSDPTGDLQIFTIYDTKVKHYNVPVFEVNKEVLIREVLNMFRAPQAEQNKYFVNAEDFQIFRIGSYHKATGMIDACHPEHVANMHEIKALVEPRLNSLTDMSKFDPSIKPNDLPRI